MNDVAWAILGGGIHGVHLAVRLRAEGRLEATDLAIVDPAPTLLHRWHTCTSATGMTHLRSPGVHHLDVEPWSLHRFAGARPGHGRRPDFAAPYDRPSVSLFARHSAALIDEHRLAERHVRGIATSLTLTPSGVDVRLEDGRSVRARRVILAVGASSQPQWPAWASAARAAGAPVHHVFDPHAPLVEADLPADVTVVGAGISGVQVALRLAGTGRSVQLVSRHAVREHTFDSDPGWLGPKHMRSFVSERSATARRAMITAARHRGSVPADVHRALRDALLAKRLSFVEADVHDVRVLGDGLRVDTTRGSLRTGALLLATGFERKRPGGPLVDTLAHEHGLRCAACGYPLVDTQLRWHPRVHVSGPLAELELGPVARNIAGARRAAERIVAAARA